MMNKKETIENILNEIIAEYELFIVKFDLSAKNDIKIYLDGDAGVPINTISRINRSLYKKIEEAAIFDEGDFSLEVSSPGVDEPLVFNRQYPKHIGRNMEITLKESNTVLEGKLLEVSESEIKIQETKDKKKKIYEDHVIPFESISKAIVQISF